MKEIPGRAYSYEWEGADGCRECIIWTGGVLVWKVLRPPNGKPIGDKRKEIFAMSDASRWRLLKTLHSIDWEAAFPALFVTTTYPDEVECFDAEDTNVHRANFFRNLEFLLGRKVPAIWRKEFQDRKSGGRKGWVYPHFHFVLPHQKFISFEAINDCWKRAVSWEGYIRTDVDRVRCKEDVQPYIAKYVAKSSCSLVHAAYHNNFKPGRQWGILRKKLLPVRTQMDARLPNSETLQEIKRRYRTPSIERLNPAGDGFTLIGPKAEELGELFFGDLLDGEEKS